MRDGEMVVAGRTRCLLLALVAAGCGTVGGRSKCGPGVELRIVDLRRADWKSVVPAGSAFGPEWAVATIQVRNGTSAAVGVGTWSLPTVVSIDVREDMPAARLIARPIDHSAQGVDMLVCASERDVAPWETATFVAILACRLHLELDAARVVVGLGEPTLASLDDQGPALIDRGYLCRIGVEVRSEAGGPRTVLGDELIWLLAGRALTVRRDEGHAPVSDCFAEAPAEATRRLVDWAVKTHRETIAYRLAVQEGAVPSGFDPDQVSPFCYSGDEGSPLRPLGPKTLAMPTLRTNLPSAFGSLRRLDADLWEEIEGELWRLEGSGDGVRVAAKARWVLLELAGDSMSGSDRLR